MVNNDFFERMFREALNELASGEKSWKKVETNVLIMACMGMLANHLAHTITKPLWFAATAIAMGVIWWGVKGFLGF